MSRLIDKFYFSTGVTVFLFSYALLLSLPGSTLLREPDTFWQIHRSTIVNLRAIARIERDTVVLDPHQGYTVPRGVLHRTPPSDDVVKRTSSRAP